ncbi:phosphoribosylanthranilate isomerase [Salinispirillum sp. LH 10-3-1]|uniref:N-(5'-phosphoribosyl)anthranilate isomerase n=1 Tax=Salinispirillum sp. LH 10-3-1 TaxID=2952525 RepID=A0AB38YCA5_9GAMM
MVEQVLESGAPMRTRIKICGLREHEHVLAAVHAGADALGFVFYPPSPRAVSPAEAAELIAGIPPFVTSVGLVVNPQPELVEQLLNECNIDLLQFHGDEDDAFCRQFGRPFIKAIRMAPGLDIEATLEQWPSARGLLLDAWHPDLPGGTGEQFDWSRIPERWRSRIILAGGLAPDNVATAIRTLHPYAVDVSGGVEASKGVKSTQRIQAFIAAVRQEDKHHD